MKNLKTNVSIKFTTIEEYREIERVLVSMGYVNDKDWNEYMLGDFNNFKKLTHVVDIYEDLEFTIHLNNQYNYKSLKEFLT